VWSQRTSGTERYNSDDTDYNYYYYYYYHYYYYLLNTCVMVFYLSDFNEVLTNYSDFFTACRIRTFAFTLSTLHLYVIKCPPSF
jgi:hypothetical protein